MIVEKILDVEGLGEEIDGAGRPGIWESLQDGFPREYVVGLLRVHVGNSWYPLVILAWWRCR